MSKRANNINDARMHLSLPRSCRDQLQDWAERQHRTTHRLATEIICNWLMRPDVKAMAAHLKAQDAAVITQAMKEAEHRAAIVRGWREARRNARKRHETIGRCTAGYLAGVRTLDGRRIPARTLWLWDRRYATGGVNALLDGRRIKGLSTTKEGRSKGH